MLARPDQRLEQATYSLEYLPTIPSLPPSPLLPVLALFFHCKLHNIDQGSGYIPSPHSPSTFIAFFLLSLYLTAAAVFP